MSSPAPCKWSAWATLLPTQRCHTPGASNTPSRLQMAATRVWEWSKSVYRRNWDHSVLAETETQLRATKVIWVNGQRHCISANLYEALLLFQATRSPDEEYWIDAVCINQRDLVEKSAQVQMMGRIYQSADRVLVWLGSCAPKRSQGVPGLEALVQMPPEQRPQYPPLGGLFSQGSPSVIRDPQEDIAGVPIKIVAETAMHLTNRQWFKRTWVLQEFFLARQVIFFYGDCQISLDAILTAFNWTFSLDDTTTGLQGNRVSLTKVIAAIWAPHNENMLATLLAHSQFALGHRFSLREWMQVCQGRLAEDPRDFVFGGLSLIDPTSLQIDAARLQGNISEEPPQDVPSLSLTPKGLWSALAADYTASEGEVLVNLAACLLSTPPSHPLDLLSLAARPPKTTIQIKGEAVQLRPEPNLDGLPSWVPGLGTTVNLVRSNLADAVGAARGGGTVFAAGLTGSTPSPRISHNGTVLFLDAAPLDVVEVIIDVNIFVHAHNIKLLVRFLDTLARMPHAYPGGPGTSFDAVATTLASLLSSSHSFLRNSSGMTADSGGAPAPSAPAFESPAPVWLCEMVEREVRIWVDSLRQDLERAADENRKQKEEQLDSLVSSYRHLCSQYYDLPWSRTAEHGLAGLDEQATTERVEGGHIGERLALTLMGKTINSIYHFLNGRELDESDRFWDQTQPTYPLSPQAREYENALDLRLSNHSLFQTRDGLLGMGPFWLREGDQVMIVQGAIVPYIFRSAETQRRIQIDAMQEQVVKLESYTYAAAKKENIAMLKEKISQLQVQPGQPDAWILIGEAYVEGVMRGEALAGFGEHLFERIAIT